MNYFGQWSNLELLRQDGTTRLAADVLHDVPYVVLLFGASWHGETQQFFPLLERFYAQHHEAKGFEVVYISRDYNGAEMLRGFLTQERAITAEARQQRRDRKVERHRQHTPQHAGTSSAKEHAEDGRSKAERNEDAHNAGDHAPSSSSSSPPPLKRVAELNPGKATNSFSGPLASPTASHPAKPHLGDDTAHDGPGFWAVPYDHVGIVGVPILYHLRIFSYPGVVVCRNKPLDLSVTPQLLPALTRPFHVHETAAEADAVPAAAAPTETDSANAPRRRQNTPMVARRVCYPDVVTIAGRFMLESEDPTGEHFPWAHMGSQVRFAALLFFAIVVAVSAVVLSVVVPAVITVRQAKRAAAAASAERV